LKKSLRKQSQETQQKPQSEDSESEIRNLENSLFHQMAQVRQPMQPEPPQGEFPSQAQSSLELEAAAMRLKLEQNSKAQQDQGIQSASDKIKQLNNQQ
jgi:hypothetical protein